MIALMEVQITRVPIWGRADQMPRARSLRKLPGWRPACLENEGECAAPPARAGQLAAAQAACFSTTQLWARHDALISAGAWHPSSIYRVLLGVSKRLDAWWWTGGL